MISISDLFYFPCQITKAHVFLLDIGDGLIEVIGLENCLHMGRVRTGLTASGRRLAQCSSIIIKTKKTFPMQIDGEPWMQPPTTVCFLHLKVIKKLEYMTLLISCRLLLLIKTKYQC